MNETSSEKNSGRKHEPSLGSGSGSTTIIEHIPFTTDDGIGSAARIGLVTLASDYTMEHEFRRVFSSPEIDFFSARIKNSPDITPQTLAAMEQGISNTVDLILPGETLDVVAFGCTSASVVLGEKLVFERIAEAQPKAASTTPITAAFRAFDAFNAKKIAVLTPYRADVNKQVQQYIERAGYRVAVFGSFNEEHDPTVARIDQQSLEAAVDQIITGHDVEAVFVSCTNVRLMNCAAAIEKRLGIPVTSSNHAMAWHCLRLAGSQGLMPELGQLYTLA